MSWDSGMITGDWASVGRILPLVREDILGVVSAKVKRMKY